MTFTKTRIAPTPSGFIHLGNILSFLITAALARQNGAIILLRIDDIDQERVKKKYVEDIFDSLIFMGIPWDEGPKNFREYHSAYSQTHRLKFYKDAIDYLKDKNYLFACDCSRRKISRESPDGSYPGTCKKKRVSFEDREANWRLDTVREKVFLIKNISGNKIKVSIPPLLRDFVVRRKDKMPSYQLSSVVDDMLDKVDFIVRGKDLWGSSIAQVYLSDKLPESHLGNATFFHHPLMRDSENRKISKSSGATSLKHQIKSGLDKSDIYRLIGDFLQLKEPVSSFEDFLKVFSVKSLK